MPRDEPAAGIAALLQALSGELVAHDSATSTLERWCRQHGICPDPAPMPLIAAERLSSDAVADGDGPRAELAIGESELLILRRVRLTCSGLVLSHAENWFVPGRLSPDMNRALARSDAPFGRVIASLNFRRQTLSAHILWHPDAAEIPPIVPECVPEFVIKHTARLTLPDGTPLALVAERYTRNILPVSARGPT